MTDYIERGGIMALIEAEERLWGEDYDARQILGDIENYPAADVRPVVRGEWVYPRPDSKMCSCCGTRFYISALFAVGGNEEPNFCPNCGAEMRREDEG